MYVHGGADDGTHEAEAVGRDLTHVTELARRLVGGREGEGERGG